MLISPLERALTYPYLLPAGSFLYSGGEVLPYRPPSAMAERRYPVIGYGSNRSPAQLGRKYPGSGDLIPVENAWLEGFDAVYSARIGSYGAIPATIAPCPGCRLGVKVTWLSKGQLPAMHQSEGIGVAYDFGVLEAPLLAEHSGLLPRALVYVGRRGAYAPAGEPVALAEVEAQERCWRAMSQRAMQQHLADLLAPGLNAEAFVETSITDLDARGLRSQRMGELALPWQDRRFRPLSCEDPL